MRTERMVALFGLLAGLLALAMATISFSHGVSQEYFETLHPVKEYAEKLKSQAATLRVLFTLDNFFLLAYTGFFLWYAVERQNKAHHWLLATMLVFLFLVSLLDAAENFHILAMLQTVELNQLPSDGQISLQYILSAVKFMVAYFAVIILGVTYPRDTLLARMIGVSTAIGFPLLGVLSFTVPPPWSMVCGIGRALFFVLGFLLSAVVYWNRGTHENYD